MSVFLSAYVMCGRCAVETHRDLCQYLCVCILNAITILIVPSGPVM